MNFDEKNTLGEWASTYAGASTVFIKNGLDFCAGGAKSLARSCSEKGIKVEKVISEVQECSKGRTELAWNQLKVDQMVDDIIEKFHNKHRRDLATLIPLSRKVESVHANSADSPQGLAEFLEKLLFELESHMQKEEKILFPMIKSGQTNIINGPIYVMMQEHVGHIESLVKLKILAKNYKLPADACRSWTALYQGVENLEREIMEHIALENNLLFPNAVN